jgi:hypothetical protein
MPLARPRRDAGRQRQHPATDCSGTHNALTYATGDDEGKPPFDDAIKKTCEDEFTTAVGLTLEQANLTIYSWAWYQPSAQQYAEGARAYRCDLVASNTDSGDRTIFSWSTDRQR